MANSEQVHQFSDGLEITVSNRAPEIFDALLDNYKQLKARVEIILPQKYRPSAVRPGGEYYGSHEHAMYFWNICSYMQGRTESNHAFKKLTEIFDECPDYFDSHRLAECSRDEIFSTLKEHGLGQQGRVARDWTENAQRLVDRYDGDPRNIFIDSSTYEECRDKIINDKKGGGFLGFQKKMVSMLFYYFTDDDLVKKTNFPPPIDFHNLRLAFATETLIANRTSFRKRNKIEGILGRTALDYINNTGTDPIELTDSIWKLSEGFCDKNLGNKSYADKNGKRTIRKEPELATYRQSEAFFRSCGMCALKSSFCKHCVPSGPYYDLGTIEVWDKLETMYLKQSSIF